MPISSAMDRTLQCVALAGRSLTVFSTTASLTAALSGLRPGGLERPSTSPSTPASAKYSCQRQTVVFETPTSRMIAYAYVHELNRREFAWEYLRRNPSYRRDY